MKKFFKCIAVILIVGGIGAMIYSGVVYGGFSGYEEYNVTVTLDEPITAVDIDVTRNYVIIEKGAANEIRYNDSDRNNINFINENGVLKITNDYHKQAYNKGFMLMLVLDSVAYDYVSINSSVAPITINELEATNGITAHTTNGKIRFDNVITNKIDARTSNAGYEFDTVKSSDVTATSSNGGAVFKDCVIDKIGISLSNGGIDISNSEFGGETILRTSNGSIEVDNTVFKTDTTLQTSNSSISVDNSSADIIRLETGNAKIFADNLTAHAVSMRTSNASIETHRLQVKRVSAVTGNAKIWLEIKGDSNMFNRVEREESIDSISDYTIATRTSNGKAFVTFVN